MMNLQVEKNSAVPLYFQVKEAVRAMVARGELRPGDMLPSEVCLSEELGISRLTVHRALRELVAEGLLVRQRAKGTFVALPRWQPYQVEGPLLSLSEDLTQAG
ncbi:MAG: GntR family transcriptional regulator, partial [Chloroflexi bacterium]|nr:GntR family transcriptional regulator [Chloroflexota bacterium]